MDIKKVYRDKTGKILSPGIGEIVTYLPEKGYFIVKDPKYKAPKKTIEKEPLKLNISTPIKREVTNANK